LASGVTDVTPPAGSRLHAGTCSGVNQTNAGALNLTDSNH